MLSLRIPLISVSSIVSILAACSSKEPADTSSSTNPTSTRPACGWTLFSPADDPVCQPALDRACCPELEACAQNPDCIMLIGCVNACTPRSQPCIDACARRLNKPGVRELEAIATCSKGPNFSPPPGSKCAWP